MEGELVDLKLVHTIIKRMTVRTTSRHSHLTSCQYKPLSPAHQLSHRVRFRLKIHPERKLSRRVQTQPLPEPRNSPGGDFSKLCNRTKTKAGPLGPHLSKSTGVCPKPNEDGFPEKFIDEIGASPSHESDGGDPCSRVPRPLH